MKLRDIETPVSSLAGVGSATAKLFARLGVFTVGELLTLWPRSYDDRTERRPLSDWRNGKVHTVAQVTAHQWFGYGRMKTLKICISDGTVNATMVCFNRPFLEKTLPVGAVIAVTAPFAPRYNELTTSSFEAVCLAKDEPLAAWQGRPVPNSSVLAVYPLTAGLSQGAVRKAMAQAIKQYCRGIDNELPPTVMERRRLMPKQEAVCAMHRPRTLAEAAEARRTLMYEELYAFQKTILERSMGRRRSVEEALAVHAGKAALVSDCTAVAGAKTALVGAGSTTGGAGTAFSGGSTMPAPTALSAPESKSFTAALSPTQRALYERLPFDLTPDQKNVITEMNRDMDLSQEVRAAGAGTALAAGAGIPFVGAGTAANAETALAAATSTGTTPSIEPFHMARLLQGDVGSGKTLVAFFLALRAVDYGGQVALLAPTELLAKQHAENAAKQLEPLGVRVAFLAGNIKAAGRKPLLKALREGGVDILIGTHALFSNDVIYKNLTFAVIDEQHRFGVVQRNAIFDKGRTSLDQRRPPAPKADDASLGVISAAPRADAAPKADASPVAPDFLLMSATPIPQTLALTVFGDLDVSTIKSMPSGRKPIVTHLTRAGHESRVYEEVRRELAHGRQAYFVYPLIDRAEQEELLGADGTGTGAGAALAPQEGFFSDGADSAAASNATAEPNGNPLKSAEEMFAFLSGQVYPEYQCALVHSKIDDMEQTRILNEFRRGAIQILVATSVVEVGVDVPNATCMVVECAERFGLAALHQLRGRVGRGSGQSYCFLIYGEKLTELGKARLRVLHESTDGFFIAEEDLRLRGPGEVTGIQQSGYFTLGLSDPVRDRALLEQARADVISELNYLV